MPETLFITSCGAVSGASLKIGTEIHTKTKIRVMYILPQRDDLVGEKLLQNRLLSTSFKNMLDQDYWIGVFS